MAKDGILFSEDSIENNPEKPAKNYRHKKVVFKPSYRHEQYLLPPSLDELIPQDHLVRFIDAVIDRLDLSKIIERYQGGGAGAFHPAMLLKLWIFGWTRAVYTSRPLAHACTRDIEFMWLSGGQKPSFMTLADFRKNLGTDIKVIFKEVVSLAMSVGLIDGKEIYIDHTKIDANANRYRITWRKNVERILKSSDEKINELLDLIDALNENEAHEYASQLERQSAINKITPELFDDLISRINQQVKNCEKDSEQAKKEKAALRKGKKQLEQKQKYTETLEKLGDKNSMAKTDTDATAMRMKDKVSTKPGYNIGIATQNGITVAYDVSNSSNDGVSFKAVVKEAESNLEQKPDRICADAGYGNVENYQFLEKEKIESYVKYPGWDKDLKGKRRPLEAESFQYISENDVYKCPAGKILSFKRIVERENKKTGYVEKTYEYKAEEADCANCKLKENCTKGSARSIRVNLELKRLRKQTVENLASPMGKRMRSLRSVEVETIFGIHKWSLGFNRFNMRGFQGVSIEYGLYLASLNLRRMHKSFVRFMHYGNRPMALVTG